MRRSAQFVPSLAVRAAAAALAQLLDALATTLQLPDALLLNCTTGDREAGEPSTARAVALIRRRITPNLLPILIGASRSFELSDPDIVECLAAGANDYGAPPLVAPNSAPRRATPRGSHAPCGAPPAAQSVSHTWPRRARAAPCFDSPQQPGSPRAPAGDYP